jgi:2-amino-4-hydroxy-6-hydroxymethyldihydropteridine diphosphokinase
MSLILATGTNLGNKKENLELVKQVLSKDFELIAQSQIFESAAVEYINQPNFYNQVLEFKLPKLSPIEVLSFILETEKNLGRVRDIDKGPRIIDIDIIFWGLENINEPGLTVPHPNWHERSFVVRPLQQLPFFKTLEKCFKIPSAFNVEAIPIK